MISGSGSVVQRFRTAKKRRNVCSLQLCSHVACIDLARALAMAIYVRPRGDPSEERRGRDEHRADEGREDLPGEPSEDVVEELPDGFVPDGGQLHKGVLNPGEEQR